MPAVLGLDAKLYRNTGTWAAPIWNEITNVRDVTLTMTKDTAEASIRGSTWKLKKGTLKDMEVSFEMIWDLDQDDFEVLLTAFLDNTTVDVLVLDGEWDAVNSQGPHFIADVSKFDRSEPLTDFLKASVTLVPSYETVNLPEWFISGGVLREGKEGEKAPEEAEARRQ